LVNGSFEAECALFRKIFQSMFVLTRKCCFERL